MNSRALTLCVFLFAIGHLASAELNCLNTDGQPVSWWSALKLPEKAGSNRHLYYDQADDQAGTTAFKVLNAYVDDKTTALYKTFDQLNSLSRDTTYILAFNDEHPDGHVQFDGAHAKGVVAWDTVSQTGFYVMHSAPKYPIVDDSNIQPTLQKNAWKYGQNFFCVGIDKDGLEAVQKNLQVTYPSVYYDNGNLCPTRHDPSKHSNATFKARMSDDQFVMLSKSPNDTASLIYEDIISPYFQERFMVESWYHPGEDPFCDRPFPNYNIKKILHKESGITFTEADDHSKWAIDYTGDKKISCNADMNRADTQCKRGGCALCFNSNANYYQALRDLVAENDADKCDKHEGFLAIMEGLFGGLTA